jgi:hypothetical protein
MKGASSNTPARGRPKSTPKSTLKEVVIPPASFQVSIRRGRRRVPPSQSPESTLSELSSMESQLSDSETPGTSAIMTPAESLTKREPLSRPTSGCKDDSVITGRGKRKRLQVDDDAILAQMLQDKEFKKSESLVKRRRRLPATESEGESIHSDSVDDPPSETETHPAKGRGTRRNLSLPSRAARESAKKSIKAEVSRIVLDTDSGDSDLSEYVSDEGVDELAESEVIDDSSASEPMAAGHAPSPMNNRTRSRLTTRTRQRRRQTLSTPAPRHAGNSWRHQRLTRVSGRSFLSD